MNDEVNVVSTLSAAETECRSTPGPIAVAGVAAVSAVLVAVTIWARYSANPALTPLLLDIAAGALGCVLDFNAHVGDPTIDLHGAWEILDPPARAAFRDRLGVDEAEWLRGRAWALGIALGTFTYYWDSMPGRRHDRLAMAGNALADFSGRGHQVQA